MGSPGQQLHHQGVCGKGSLGESARDLLDQNLHFNKISRWLICIWKCEEHIYSINKGLLIHHKNLNLLRITDWNFWYASYTTLRKHFNIIFSKTIHSHFGLTFFRLVYSFFFHSDSNFLFFTPVTHLASYSLHLIKLTFWRLRQSLGPEKMIMMSSRIGERMRQNWPYWFY